MAFKLIGAECTGTIRVEVCLHVNHVRSFPLHCDHIKALPYQVVTWYKGGSITLALVSNPTGENLGLNNEEAQEEKGQTQTGKHAWNERFKNVGQM